MKHETYLAWIDDFIFDRIEYIEDLEEFIKHSRECEKCFDELKFQYSLRRSLGDIQFNLNTDNDTIDPDWELQEIFKYYDDYIEKINRQNKFKNYLFLTASLLITIIIIYLIVNRI